MKTAAIAFIFITSKVFSQDCSLDVSDPQSPFVLSDELKFPKYGVNKTFSFRAESVFYVACPKRTQSPYIGEKGDHVACKGSRNILNIRTVEIVDFADIRCKPYGASTVQKSDKKCANKGAIFEIGFTVFKDFISMITICFDELKLVPFYCKYNNFFYDNSNKRSLQQLREDANNLYETFVCNGTDCSWADSGSAYPTTDMEAIYDNQTKILQNLDFDIGLSLLKFPLTTNTIIYTDDQTNGQKVQKAPYFDYINVVPIWDLGESLDNLISLFMMFAASDVGKIMYAGSLGVLSLENKDGEQVELYLNDGRVPVPKWLWIVLDKSEQILFYHNSPNIDEKAIDGVCSEYSSMNPSMFICSYGSVIDLAIKEFLDNDLN